MTQDQENAIIEAVAALDWTTHPDAEAVETIRAILGCPSQKAAEHLEELCVTGKLQCRSESGNHAEPWYHWQTKWKWYRP